MDVLENLIDLINKEKVKELIKEIDEKYLDKDDEYYNPPKTIKLEAFIVGNRKLKMNDMVALSLFLFSEEWFIDETSNSIKKINLENLKRRLNLLLSEEKDDIKMANQLIRSVNKKFFDNELHFALNDSLKQANKKESIRNLIEEIKRY